MMVQPAHTNHACRFCRRRRAKCNGIQPCDRCQLWGHDCVYDDRTKETKSDLRRQRDELQAQHRDAELVLGALQTEGSLSGQTFAALWNGTPLGQIALSLSQPASDVTQDATFPSSSKANLSEPATTYPQGAYESTATGTDSSTTRVIGQRRPSANDTLNSPTQIQPRAKTNPTKPGKMRTGPTDNLWGIVGVDYAQMCDLLSVFFERQFLPLLSVDQNLFMHDFVNEQETNCSDALVRAVLFTSCRALYGYDDTFSFHVNLAGRLVHECVDILDRPGRKDSLPDAQALSLLAVHQLGSHDKTDALNFVEECVRMLVSLQLGESSTCALPILSWTSEISQNLHGAISLARLIRLFFEFLHSSYSLQPDVRAHGWRCDEGRTPKRHVLSVLRTPSIIEGSRASHCIASFLVTSTSAVYCWLSTLSGDDHIAYPQELLNIYQSCLLQYTELIAASQLHQPSNTSLLLTHLIHHFSLLSLCRPFCHLPIGRSPTEFQRICLEAAQAILSLSASSLGTVETHLLPCVVPLFVHAAALVCMDVALDGHAQSSASAITEEASLPTASVTYDWPSHHIPDASRIAVPPSLKGHSSGETEPIATIYGTQHTAYTSSCDSWNSVKLSIGNPESSGLFQQSDSLEKRKFEEISTTPLTSASSFVMPGIQEALDCLRAMSSTFPAARDAMEALGSVYHFQRRRWP